MPYIRAGGRTVEYASYDTDPESGDRVYRDADGNEMFRKRADAVEGNEDGGFYASAVDPETGRTYDYALGEGSLGLSPSGRRRRDRRKTERAARRARQADRINYYGGIFNEELGNVGGAYEGLESELPSELDLLGGVENAESALAGAQADEGAIAAQRAALAQLSQIAQGGYTAEEAAAMQRMRMETAQQEQAQRQAVQQQMAMRGMAGSGAELAGQLAAQQGGANRANQQQLETQAMAQRRALQALGMQGDLSSGMRGQSFDEEATRRGATDDFTRWNLDRRGGAAQQRYANRFGLAGAQSDASARTAEMAAARRSEIVGNKRERKQAAGQGAVSGVEAVGSFF